MKTAVTACRYKVSRNPPTGSQVIKRCTPQFQTFYLEKTGQCNPLTPRLTSTNPRAPRTQMWMKNRRLDVVLKSRPFRARFVYPLTVRRKVTWMTSPRARHPFCKTSPLLCLDLLLICRKNSIVQRSARRTNIIIGCPRRLKVVVWQTVVTVLAVILFTLKTRVISAIGRSSPSTPSCTWNRMRRPLLVVTCRR